MSKRKVVAGGYEESSDDLQHGSGESPERPSKRLPPVPYAPLRVTTGSKPGLGAFQLPGAAGRVRSSTPLSRHVSLSSASSRRSTPVAEGTHIAGGTPNTPPLAKAGGLNSARRSSLADLKESKSNLEPPPASHKANGGRLPLALERQINELTETFEEYKNTSEIRHKASEGKLTRILEAVQRFDAIGLALPTSRPSTPSLSTSSALLGAKSLLSNPTATPELVTLVSKVVSEARSRVGKKKGGSDDNSCKEHARNTFYRMLAIAIASEIRPYFEDDYGEPDTLPAQFVDRETKYCRPYPHWKASLVKQVAWIPTYILRFRSTVPTDQSELSNMLRNLTDEQILILLNDGPFKSACAAWRNAKKTDLEIEAMRSSARRYQRCDRKAAVRAGHIRTIPSLQSPEWEYLYQPGYMSQDESDEEGGSTKRPEHRARWETNLFEAIQVAEREKAKSRPGLLFPRLPPFTVKLVRRPIPHLERGTGSGKATIHVALCGISKSWRQTYPDEFNKSAHLINMKASIKPDISLFLTKYPMLTIDSSESVKDEPKADHEGSDSELWAFGTQVDGQLAEGEEYGMNSRMDLGVGGDVAGEHDDEASSVEGMHDGPQECDATGMASVQGSEEIAGGLHTVRAVHIEIDPSLLREGELDDGGCSSTKSSLSLSTHQGVSSALLPALGFQMPPPPPLACNLDTAGHEQIAVECTQVKSKANKGSIPMGIEVTTSADNVPAGPAPKRRGRPPGSKNKPKM